MRPQNVAIFVVFSLVLAGCSSRTSIESIAPASNEVTGSIRPSSPAQAESVDVADISTLLDLVDNPAESVDEGLLPMANNVVPPQRPEPDFKPMALVAPAQAKTAMLSQPKGAAEVYRQRFRDAKPINFGRFTPHRLSVHGVDVSRWQGDVDWKKLRSQGANFAWIKATDGGDHLDPMFRKNWREAKQAGLKRGAYHFFYWCRTAGEQADWFIRNVPREAGALPPVIDVEWNGQSSCKTRPSRARVLEKMQVFMDKLEQHYGQRPIIYTAPDFYADNLKGAFPDYPFWLRAVAQHPSKVYPGRDWLFWQYSGSGLSHGVKGKIDLNAFHGTESQWRRWIASQERGTS